MSEAIKIKDGGVDRSQNQINKLKTNTVGGGVCFWVPETERQTDDKRITSNGTYTAEDDGLYGYDEITVSVPNTGSMSGKGADGNDYSITVDDNGYIVETKIPSAIQITTPPPRVSYNDGDTIDYSGIVVTLYDGNGNVFTDSRYPDGIVPFSELVFPVDIAHYEGGGEWTDGSGLNAMQIAYTPHWFSYINYLGHQVKLQVFCSDHILGADYYGYPATFGGNGLSTLMITRYAEDNYNYAACISGNRTAEMYSELNGEPDNPWGLADAHGFHVSGSGGGLAGDKVFSRVSWEQFLIDIPVSTVDPTTVDPATLHAVQSIPVNWISPYNADTYTDTFDIVVHETSTESGTAHGNEGGFEGGGSEHGF